MYSSIEKRRNISYPVLIPNQTALTKSLPLNPDEISIFVSSTEAFSLKNINCSVNESLIRAQTLVETAHQNGIKIRGYVSCCLGCPYEGYVDPRVVKGIVIQLIQMGCYEISLGDTIGIATPGSMKLLLKTILDPDIKPKSDDLAAISKTLIKIEQLAVHCHDTYGMALANVYSALELGVRVVDSSVGGLGGCPYAKGSSGNLATEDLVYMLNGLGYEHGVDIRKIIDAGNFISQKLNRVNQSRVAIAMSHKEEWIL